MLVSWSWPLVLRRLNILYRGARHLNVFSISGWIRDNCRWRRFVEAVLEPPKMNRSCTQVVSPWPYQSLSGQVAWQSLCLQTLWSWSRSTQYIYRPFAKSEDSVWFTLFTHINNLEQWWFERAAKSDEIPIEWFSWPRLVSSQWLLVRYWSSEGGQGRTSIICYNTTTVVLHTIVTQRCVSHMNVLNV